MSENISDVVPEVHRDTIDKVVKAVGPLSVVNTDKHPTDNHTLLYSVNAEGLMYVPRSHDGNNTITI